MTHLATLSRIEAKLVVRDVSLVASTLGIPLAVLLGWGLVPDVRAPLAELGGHRPLDVVIAPIALALVLVTLAVYGFPAYLATYRDKGVLRRFQATPVGPAALLGAQLVVSLTLAVAGIALAFGVGKAVLDLATPGNVGGFLVALLLATAGWFAIGLVIAAVAATPSAANGIGMAVFFPSMLLGGGFVPLDQLPAGVAAVGRLTPLGAAIESLAATWRGEGLAAPQVVVLLVTTVVVGALAVRVFRWE